MSANRSIFHGSKGRRLVAFLALVPLLEIAAWANANSQVPTKYRVVSVGLVQGKSNLPGAINAAGDMIGSAGGSITVPATAFVFQDNKVTDFATLGLGTANALNDRGQVVGRRAQGLYIYDHGVVTPLPAIGNDTIPTAINNLGQVAGITTRDGIQVPYLFHDGVAVTLDVPTGMALAINDAGQIVGALNTVGVAQHAFLFDNGQVVDIGTLGGNVSYPHAISREGTIVGLSTRSDGVLRPFMYRDGAFTDLGSFPPIGQSISSGTAFGVNSYDEVVGESNGAGFLWQAGSMYDLNSLLADGFTDWSIMRAAGINDAGQIAAWACQQGTQSCNAIRLEPVDPPVRAALPHAVEYYNAALDHFFMTSSSDEMRLLDDGVTVGWMRTGAYMVVQPVGDAAANPVCRFYIPPAYGDSHFFSASSGECDAVRAKFPWLRYESSDVFNVILPDPKSGHCATGTAPVYRLWNDRADSNHRYTMNWIVRDSMVAKGYVAEGYGPIPAVMCVR